VGEARQARRVPDAAGRPAAGRVPARFSLRAFGRDQSGATAIEYGLIVSLIFLAIITSVTAFGNTTTDKMQFVSDTISGAIGGGGEDGGEEGGEGG
jgi:pilus assembly protein Flp/PilA